MKPHKHSPSALPRTFRRIRLELAREAGHPEGSAGIGYQIVVPLDAAGRIDAKAWHDHREYCRVVRFRPGEADEIGHLIHGPGGAWVFHYDVVGTDADEAGYHFADEKFIVGEYVSVRDGDEFRAFRVVSVEPI